jgi:hypothetical protein
MKYFLFFILIINLPCLAQVSNTVDTNKLKTIIGEVDSRDKECTSQIAKAEKDFKIKEVYFYIIPDGYLMPSASRHHIILAQLLKEKGIAFGSINDMGIIWHIKGKETYPAKLTCYEEAHNKLLDLKYGEGFAKGIEKKADSLYVMSRINDVFKYPYEVDCYNHSQQDCLVYPKAKDFLEEKAQIKSDFKDSFKFPQGFLLKDNENEFTAHCSFVIRRGSGVSDINIDVGIHNPENVKFSENLEKQITAFITNANWKPATAAGITVNTHFEIVLSH